MSTNMRKNGNNPTAIATATVVATTVASSTSSSSSYQQQQQQRQQQQQQQQQQHVYYDTNDTQSTAVQEAYYYYYTCITCLEPNQLLYRQYSNARNIKLQTCPKCQRDVDPYIERELLLVVMDMILLRQCAYRHLFLNRYLPCPCVASQRPRTWTDTNADAEKNVDWKDKIRFLLQPNCVQYNQRHPPVLVLLILLLVAWTCMMLKMGLKFYQDDAAKDRDGTEQQQQQQQGGYCPITCTFYPIAMSCFWEMVALWFGTIGTAMFMSMDTTAKNNDSKKNNEKDQHLEDIICIRIEQEKSIFWKQLHFAILTPQLFHFMTLFVHIYENSYMVRILGKTFVFCFGYMAVGTIMEKRMKMRKNFDKKQQEEERQMTNHEKRNTTIPQRYNHDEIPSNYKMHGLPFVVGYVLEMILSLYFSSSLDPCWM